MTDAIHILGLGGVGILVAHALAGVDNRPRLNLLLHRPRNHQSGLLKVTRNGATEWESNFTVEEYWDGCWYQKHPLGSAQPTEYMHPKKKIGGESHICFLIVAVKAHHTIDSIRLVKHRLSRHSTILFLQNGLGILDELDAELFPDPSKRPYYMSGIVTHCIHRTHFLSAVHTATGSITLGTSPRITRASEASMSFQLPTDAGKLANALKRTRSLNVSVRGPHELLRQQLIKLAANSIYNPLTSLLECSVSALIVSDNPTVRTISDALVCEISAIIGALPLSEMIGKNDLESKFSPAGLKKTIYEIGLRAGEHITSMLQDMRNGVGTEIMYLNGYLMGWATRLGVKCPVNEIITRMVLKKENLDAGVPTFPDELVKCCSSTLNPMLAR